MNPRNWGGNHPLEAAACAWWLVDEMEDQHPKEDKARHVEESVADQTRLVG